MTTPTEVATATEAYPSSGLSITVTVPVPWEMIADWFSSAIEGGSNYWCSDFIISKRLPKTGTIWYARPEVYADPNVSIRFVTHEDEELNGELTQEKIIKGVRLLADTRPQTFGRMIDSDGCNWDALDADVFLQLCCFGEVVYG